MAIKIHNEYHESKKRSFFFLAGSLISGAALILLLLYVSPYATFFSIPFVSNTPIVLLFVLLSLFLFSTGTYILKSRAHGVLIAGFADASLLFLLTNLTNPFFFILLAALFLTLELFVSYRK